MSTKWIKARAAYNKQQARDALKYSSVQVDAIKEALRGFPSNALDTYVHRDNAMYEIREHLMHEDKEEWLTRYQILDAFDDLERSGMDFDALRELKG